MTRTQYKLHQRCIRDNGLRYTLAHVSASDSLTLSKLQLLANMEDMLEWRQRWINQRETTRANVIRLTSPLL
jgi:hypothetical protein